MYFILILRLAILSFSLSAQNVFSMEIEDEEGHEYSIEAEERQTRKFAKFSTASLLDMLVVYDKKKEHLFCQILVYEIVARAEGLAFGDPLKVDNNFSLPPKYMPLFVRVLTQVLQDRWVDKAQYRHFAKFPTAFLLELMAYVEEQGDYSFCLIFVREIVARSQKQPFGNRLEVDYFSLSPKYVTLLFHILKQYYHPRFMERQSHQSHRALLEDEYSRLSDALKFLRENRQQSNGVQTFIEFSQSFPEGEDLVLD